MQNTVTVTADISESGGEKVPDERPPFDFFSYLKVWLILRKDD